MTSPEAATVSSERARWVWPAVPLYLLVLALVGLDVYGTVFWARVGGALGTATAVVGIVVAVVLIAVLVADVRRRWRRISSSPPPSGRGA